ncbi:hypothetical protein BpHYR1_050864 [Brachionus plicatilis]|uniref:Uncharacterized protein n=1 Tax=Brachionus plicatilis TaxID=10195 RepID=A0A3M7QXS0_BRAPC|nr:hypothetical protein BpHYR1_050864 [Brachionus plicatilis]
MENIVENVTGKDKSPKKSKKNQVNFKLNSSKSKIAFTQKRISLYRKYLLTSYDVNRSVKIWLIKGTKRTFFLTRNNQKRTRRLYNERSPFCRDFAHHYQTFTVATLNATLNVAPLCIHRINFKLLEKNIINILITI